MMCNIFWNTAKVKKRSLKKKNIKCRGQKNLNDRKNTKSMEPVNKAFKKKNITEIWDFKQFLVN